MKIRLVMSGVAAMVLSVLTAPAALIAAYHTNGTSTATVQSAVASYVGTGITAGNAVFDRGANDAWRTNGFGIDTGDVPKNGLSGRKDVWHVWRGMGTSDPVSTAIYEAFTITRTAGPTLEWEKFTFDVLIRSSTAAWDVKYAVFASVNSGAFQTLGTGSAVAPTTEAWYDPFSSPVTVDISSLGELKTGDSVEFRLALGGSHRTDQGIFTQGIQVSAIPEPASGLMLLGSVAALGLLRRKLHG